MNIQNSKNYLISKIQNDNYNLPHVANISWLPSVQGHTHRLSTHRQTADILNITRYQWVKP